MQNPPSTSSALLPNNECPEVPYPETMRNWFALCDELPYLKYVCGFPLHEPAPPRRMPKDQFAGLVGSLVDDDQQPILVRLLMDMLRSEVEKLIAAATEDLERKFEDMVESLQMEIKEKLAGHNRRARSK